MSDPDKLLDYLIVVGPSTKVPEETNSTTIPEITLSPSPPPPGLEDGEWDSIYKPGPAILRRFPEEDIPSRPLADNVVYFCQPEGCVRERHEEASHIFMLTNTETNIRTYGTCISIPHLIDPLARAQSRDWQYENQDSVSIQEWGVLSVCLLSQCQCFRFFKQCLRTLIHFIEHFCASRLTWELLIHSKFASVDDESYAAVRELERWIKTLMELPVPRDGTEVLEVELEVDPAVLVGFPPLSRLPLFDMSINELFEMLDVHLVIEIFQLLLLEQKVIVHSEDQGFASQCILTIVTLLYPLQYLFPVIPLLPTILPNVENLLLVPTPYFIGVCTSFLEKVCTFHCAEAWIIDLDKKTVTEPRLHKPIRPKLPLSLHTLQADVRRSLDKLCPASSPDSSGISIQDISNSDVVSLEDKVDVQIRLAFADYLLGDEMLGLIENHLAIYRLFPRPVVSLKLSSFLKAYSWREDFVKGFVRSQSVEYYLEWCLNPSNKAFEEIKKGFCDIDRVGDKLPWWIRRTHPTRTQYTIYSTDPSSILYQEMLSHKATQTGSSSQGLRLVSSVSDDSEFEMVGHEYYNGGSDIASSYYSDNGSSLFSPQPPDPTTDSVPVSIEFHPATPTELAVITSTAAAPPLRDEVSNETFLSLQANSDSQSDDPPSSPSPEQHQVLPATPEPLNTSPECVSLPGEHGGFYTPEPFQDPENSNGNSESSVITVSASTPAVIPLTPVLITSAEPSGDLIELKKLPSSEFQTPTAVMESGRGSPSLSEPSSSTFFLTPEDFNNKSTLSTSLNSPIRGGVSDPLFLVPPLDSGNLRKTVIERGKMSASPEPSSNIHRSNSWLNLAGGGIEMLQFTSTNQSMSGTEGVDGVDRMIREGSPVHSSGVIRSVPWSAVSSLHELETQIKDIVGRIGDGYGLPWPKPQALKIISGEERSRIALLRVLEVRLGVRKQTDTKLSADGEIKPVIVSKAVYKGVLELLKYLVQSIEAELTKDLEHSVFSLFLIFRLALCLCMTVPRKRPQSTKITPSRPKSDLKTQRKASLPEEKSTGGSSILDAGSSSLAAAETENEQTENNPSQSGENTPSQSVDNSGHDDDHTDGVTSKSSGANGGPQEIEMQQIAGDSPPPPPRRYPPPPQLVKTPSKKVIISSPLPQETGEGLLTYVYLHNDLIRGLGPGFKDLVVKRQFWINVFASVVHTDRKYLGWNEKTSELYDRYNRLPREKRKEFSYEEDVLLSVILHNILVFLLMMGISPTDTIDLCHRLSAKTRLASIEEKLLQQTLTELEDAEPGDHIDVKDLAVLSLYSETHSVVIFVVHHGVSVVAPIFKLQITDDVCILRRFPDEKITCRFWNDCISSISLNEDRMTVSFSYQESQGEYTHHFHSKQFIEIYRCLQMLVHSEQRSLSPST